MAALRPDSSGIQPRREPRKYQVWDYELDLFAAPDPWTFNRNIPFALFGAGLTLGIEGVISDGWGAPLAIVGAILLVAAIVWLLWATFEPSERMKR